MQVTRWHATPSWHSLVMEPKHRTALYSKKKTLIQNWDNVCFRKGFIGRGFALGEYDIFLGFSIHWGCIEATRERSLIEVIYVTPFRVLLVNWYEALSLCPVFIALLLLICLYIHPCWTSPLIAVLCFSPLGLFLKNLPWSPSFNNPFPHATIFTVSFPSCLYLNGFTIFFHLK